MKTDKQFTNLILLILITQDSFSILTGKSIKSTQSLSNGSPKEPNKIFKIAKSRLLYLVSPFNRRRSTSPVYADPVAPPPTQTTPALPPADTSNVPRDPLMTVNSATVTQNSNDNYLNQVNLNQSGKEVAINMASVTQNTNNNFGNQAGVIQDQNKSGGVNLSNVVQAENNNALNQVSTLQSVQQNGVNFSQTVQKDNVGALNLSQTTQEFKDTPLGSLAFNVGLKTNGNAAVAVQSYFTNSYDPAQFWAFAKQFEQQTDPK